MVPDQIKLIQESFAKVAPLSEQAAVLFYGRLFEIAPEVKPLFRSDMTEQGRKLMATLAVVINGLNDLDSILPTASALAKRHVDYDLEAADYEAALLWALERGLGAHWSAGLAAWGAAYGLFSNFMIGEAYGRSAAAE